MSTDKSSAGWSRVKFGDLVRNVNENSRDLVADGLERVVGLDHLDPGSLHLARWDNLADLPDGTTFTRRFRRGQVLFGKRRAYQRKVAVPNFEGVCSSDILVFEPSDSRMLTEFLPYLVQSDGFLDHALGTSAGSLSPRTKWADLARYEFAIPPIEEQRRIAAIFSACDKTLDTVRAALGATQLVGDAVGDMPLADGERTVQLGDLCDVLVGFPFKSDSFVSFGVRLTRCSNVGPSALRWGEKETVHIDALSLDQYEKFQLAKDDLVIAMDGTFTAEGFKLASVSESDLPALLVQRVARLRPTHSNLGIDELGLILRSRSFQNWLQQGKTQTTVAHISGKLIERFPISLDWLESSAATAGRTYAGLLGVRADLIEHVERLQMLRRSLLTRLLSEEVVDV